MNFMVCWTQLFLAVLLNVSALQAAHIPKEGKRSTEPVVPFMKVYIRSSCSPREVLVDVHREYPHDTDCTYIPSCVVLQRCAGCCNDEALECVPRQTQNITLEVYRVKPGVGQHQSVLSFTEHTNCDCKAKANARTKKEYQCEPCSDRKKRLFVQDPVTCKCSCKLTELQCQSKQLELNERACRCDKPRR